MQNNESELFYCKYSITANLAEKMIKAAEINVPMVIAVLNESAYLKAFVWMERL